MRLDRTHLALLTAGALALTAGSAAAGSLITGASIKDGTITARDLAPGLRAQMAKAATPRAVVQGAPALPGPRGPEGPVGAQGPTGPAGPAAPAATAQIRYQWGAGVSVAPRDTDTTDDTTYPPVTYTAEATCPAGSKIAGGGFDVGGGGTSAQGVRVLEARPIVDHNLYRVRVTNWDLEVRTYVIALAMCLTDGS